MADGFPLPTFLLRGHPDCVARPWRGCPDTAYRPDPLAHTGRRKTPAQVAALALLGYSPAEMRCLKPRAVAPLLRAGTSAAAFRTRRALREVR